MADLETTLATVIYYARERHYRHMQNVLVEQLRRFGSDPLLVFWRAFGLVMEERLSDGMRELAQVQDRPELVIASSLVLIHAHKRCETVDKEAVQQLENTVRGHRSTAGEKALYYGAVTLWLLQKHDKAREYTEKLLQRVAPKSRECRALRGWIDLTSSREQLIKKSIKFFDEALQGSEADAPLDAFLGKARFYTTRYNFVAASDVLTHTITAHPSFLPALIEKMRVELAFQEWDTAVETAHRCLSFDNNCIEATKMLALELCVRKGDMDEASGVIENLIEQLDSSEPRSHWLYYDCSQGFTRLAGGHQVMLQQTQTLLERAISLAPTHADYTIELGHHLLIEGKLQEALQTYRRAFSIDEMSIPAMVGLLHCQLLLGKTAEAQQRLEFLNELQTSVSSQAYLAYLNALLAGIKGATDEEVVTLLIGAADTHFTALKGMHLSYEYFKMIDPDFVKRLAETMMSYGPSEPAAGSSRVLQQVVTVLDPITHTAPGLTSILLLLARVKFICGDSDAALATTHQCIERGHQSVEALLLQALIHLHLGNTHKCAQSLETALSNNFGVQQYALYHLLKGRLERSTGKWSNARASLQTVLSLVKTPKKNKSESTLLPPLSLSQEATAYTELVQVHSLLGEQDAAAKVMQEAIGRFSGTTEEARVTISSADFALSSSNNSEALMLLQKITEDNPYYIQSREKMAEIFLLHFGDSHKYISCYQDLAEKLPGPPTAILLGDAYLNVHEPELALSVFEKALRKNSRDAVLASKVGQVLVRTHQYAKAINYYETSLKTESMRGLSRDLASLYLRLTYYDKAVQTLQTALEHKNGEAGDELSVMMEDVQHSLLLSKAHQLEENTARSTEVLRSAKELQLRVLRQAAVEQPEALPAQKQLAASITCQLADQVMAEGPNAAEVQTLYQEALEHDPNFTKAHIALAQLYIKQGQLDKCEEECSVLLQADPSNEEGALMMADLMFQRGEMESARKYLEDSLESKPDNFEALVRLIELMRRAGKLKESAKFITMVESHCTQLVQQAGLCYCRGLYQRYTGETEQALQSFNHARKDSEWGERATFNMVLICLNPDNDILGGETLKAMEADSGAEMEHFDTELMAVRTAEKLLKEIRPQFFSSHMRVKVLENYVLLATKSKQNTEKALANFTEMMANEQGSVSVLLGMAIAHLFLKQVPRARNHLKRVSKMNWNIQVADDFEKSWLLLADIYIQSGKYDMAVDLLKKCLHYNKSCSKAWEYFGFISEKEQAYKDAADHYEKAWTFSHHMNPAVGYRLAFNYLKAHQYIDAVDVCHQVLQEHPSYPRIRKEIMDKARQNIRL